jgi:hypothetical protein
MNRPPAAYSRLRFKTRPRVGPLRMATRLLLGAVLIGTDELVRHFGAQQQLYRPTPEERHRLRASETESDRRRYAAIGLLVETAATAHHLAASFGILADRAYRLFSRPLQPLLGSRLVQPARRRFDRLVAHGEEVTRRWIETGRAEEQLSRTLAQEVGIETIEGTLDYLARSPEMDQLVQEQSLDLVEGIVDEAQEQVISTRAFIVEWLRANLLRRSRKTSIPAEHPDQEHLPKR